MEQNVQLLITALVAGAGGYLGSYLRQKGKNLATREDLDPIVRRAIARKRTSPQEKSSETKVDDGS